MKKIDWKPVTIEECMKALQEVLAPDEQIQITKFSEDELHKCHHGLGQWIRNNWDLWAGGPLKTHMESLGFIHPDDMSSSIIKEFWNRMNKLPSSLQEEIKSYKEFWSKPT